MAAVPPKRSDDVNVSPPRRPTRRSSAASGASGATWTRASTRVPARGGREEGAVDDLLGVLAILRALEQRAADPAVAAERGVGRVALEEVGQAGAGQVAPGERAAGDERRAQQPAHAHARDPDLAEAARAAQVAGRLVDLREGHADAADAALVEPHPRDPGAELRANAVDVDLALDAVGIADRLQVDVGHVARGGEADLDPAVRGLAVAVGRPHGARVAVEGLRRRVLGELEQAALGGRA